MADAKVGSLTPGPYSGKVREGLTITIEIPNDQLRRQSLADFERKITKMAMLYVVHRKTTLMEEEES
jgi:hypothetical protein